MFVGKYASPKVQICFELFNNSTSFWKHVYSTNTRNEFEMCKLFKYRLNGTIRVERLVGIQYVRDFLNFCLILLILECSGYLHVSIEETRVCEPNINNFESLPY